jgi:hypothetical protein
MDDLAKLTGAGRTIDSVPGLIFSPFRLEEIAMTATYFAQRHIKEIGAACAGLPDKIAEKFIAAAESSVAMRRFSFGTAAFTACAFDSTNLPFLTWMALRPAQEGMTRDDAAKIIVPANEVKITRVVLECAGYDLASKRKGREEFTPVDFVPIFASLREKGVMPDAARKLTIDQVLDVLGCRSNEDEANDAATKMTNAMRDRQTDEVLDAVCSDQGISLAQLAERPAEDVARWIKDVRPNLAITKDCVGSVVFDAVKRRGGHAR